MKRGRTSWTTKVSRPALERIQAAIDGGDDARAVFDRFHISQYGVTPRTFRRWCVVRRRDWGARQEAPPAAETTATAETLLASVLETIQVELDAGRIDARKLPQTLQAVARARELDFAARVEARAGELHTQKMRELQQAQGAAMEGAAQEARLSPEQVALIRARVLGL